MKKLLPIIILTILTLSLYGCSAKDAPPKNQTGITVYTSIYPLYDFASKIGQDKVHIYLMTPPGAEPHDWEPSARLMAQMENADILIYNGLDMELWIEKAIASINNPNLTIVNASNNAKLLKLVKDNHEDGRNPVHGNYDPHIWLNPINAIVQAENIKNALVEVDSDHKDFYENNFDELKSRLEDLDERYSTTLSQLSKKDIVVSHAAFGYLANRYGLNQYPISGLSPQAEPTPSQMAALSDFIKENNIEYIFFESLSNPKLANVIAKETGTNISILNPLGGLTQEEIDLGEDYFSIMEKNLVSIKNALGE
ncbi:MAG: zinc ABC transporter substrate-binding protein [Epulopiscium sp.]|nr:zinc ABC transporter substrate-binding protein [Candidatus Epulonipiscium sp.]